MNLPEGVQQAGTTIVMVTDSQEDSAEARRSVSMPDGRIVAETTA